jgi:hypothetical protein
VTVSLWPLCHPPSSCEVASSLSSLPPRRRAAPPGLCFASCRRRPPRAVLIAVAALSCSLLLSPRAHGRHFFATVP